MTFLEKIKKLPSPISTFFLSDNPRIELEKSCYMYGLDDEVIIKIAPKVGFLYIDEIKLKDLPFVINKETNLAENVCYGVAYEINSRIFNRFSDFFKDSATLLQEWERKKASPKISEQQAYQKILEVEPWILEEKEEQERLQKNQAQEKAAFLNTLIQPSLNQALRDFPEVGEQLITNDRIELKNFPGPSRPSIKNWLADYTFTLGQDKHSPMDRGIYLFQNENTKKLTSQERQRLSFILKAFDEGTPVSVNKTAKQIVFDAETNDEEIRKQELKTITRAFTAIKPNSPQPPANQAPSLPIRKQVENSQGKISFSSPQKLPFEKSKQEPFRILPSGANNIVDTRKNIGGSPIQPKNVVNLKELQ